MGLIDRWTNRPPRVNAHPPISVASQQLRDETRRELLTMAVRETLRKNGIPAHWFATEAVSTLTAARQRGMQLRLVFREWQPQMLAYTVALQRAIEGRLLRMDLQAIRIANGITGGTA